MATEEISTDDFAQTGGAVEDLFDSEISSPQPTSTPTEPRNFNSNHPSRVPYQPRGGNRSAPGESIRRQDGISLGAGLIAPKSSGSDRSLSGGVKKPKLTEEELAERMARVKFNNERRVEARRKAEEDETRFREQEKARVVSDVVLREKELQKSAEAEKNRKELNNEREKNRQRKLKAVQNREWDAEKKEEDYNPVQNNPRYRKGAHGTVTSSSAAQKSRHPNGHDTLEASSIPAQQQWPSLVPDSGNPVAKDEKSSETKSPALLSPAIGGSWAEQVEASSNVVTNTT